MFRYPGSGVGHDAYPHSPHTYIITTYEPVHVIMSMGDYMDVQEHRGSGVGHDAYPHSPHTYIITTIEPAHVIMSMGDYVDVQVPRFRGGT